MESMPIETVYRPGLAAYEDLLKQYQDLSPSLNALERMLFEMYDLGIAKTKHREFHDKSPFSKYACGNWYMVSTMKLLFPRFCREAHISNPNTGGKYMEAFIVWMPERAQATHLSYALSAESLAEALMLLQKALNGFLRQCQNAGLKIPDELDDWRQLSSMAEEIAEVDDMQYRSLHQLPRRLLAPSDFFGPPQ